MQYYEMVTRKKGIGEAGRPHSVLFFVIIHKASWATSCGSSFTICLYL